ALIRIAADIEWLKSQGVPVERFNLAQQPQMFIQTPQVREALERTGNDALPVTLLDDTIALTGRYPTRSDLAGWLGLEVPFEPAKRGEAPTSCGCKPCCC
ncbi:MAG: arsenic metallochaperone ArsD family protein, partial [Planctomycetaceae bacterium]|nr:arsenic metallochaperone ArsD family protein [Planctomycetaceae bacterium]